MSATDCPEEVRELLGVAALGKLTAAEDRELALHLDTCAACRAELAGLRQVTALLPPLPLAGQAAGADVLAGPWGATDSVASGGAGGSGDRAPAAGDGGRVASSPWAARGAAPSGTADLLLARARREQRRRRVAYAGAAAAVVALLGIGGGLALTHTDKHAVQEASAATLVAGRDAPGAHATLAISRTDGVTKIGVDADGLPANVTCHLLVTWNGHQEDVFDWKASYDGEAGVTGDTPVRIVTGDVATVVDEQGRQLLVGVAR